MRFAIAAWLILLVAVSLSPLEFKVHLHTRGRLHDIFHVLAFCVTAYLLVISARSWTYRLVGALLAVLAAFGTEWLEHHFYNNRIEWGDVRLDAFGVAAGLLLAVAVRSAAVRRSGTLA